jgi:hypothetical protein
LYTSMKNENMLYKSHWRFYHRTTPFSGEVHIA